VNVMSQDLRLVQLLREIKEMLAEMRSLMIMQYVEPKVQRQWKWKDTTSMERETLK